MAATFKVSLSDRERNFCEDENHRTADNQKSLILSTRDNELDDEKPLDSAKLQEYFKTNAAKIQSDLKMIELGGIKLTQADIDTVANCGAKSVQCLRLYDCVGLTDETLKLFGQRFGKTISHLELIDKNVTENGIRALIQSIGNLEVIHLDNAIVMLAEYSGTITNLRHVWSKVNGEEELDKLSQFTVKYAPYLRHLDITLANTKDKSGKFIELLANLTGLTKLSITITGNVNVESELCQALSKIGANLNTFNLCCWSGGDRTMDAISNCTNLEQLTLNGRSPMRHIDFRLDKPISAALSKCTKLKNVRLILKNHSKQVLEQFDGALKSLETLELEGLDIEDSMVNSLSGLSKLGFLDIVSPQITDVSMSALIPKLTNLSFLRVNDAGSEKIGMKTLDAIAGEARRRQPQPIEFVFTETAKIDAESRKSMLPDNLTVSQRNSIHLVSFPGSTPRGF